MNDSSSVPLFIFLCCTLQGLNPQGAPVMSSINLPILLLFLISQGVPEWVMAHDNSSDSSTTTVKVGVILDMDTWIGSMSWSCISMAVDDFYMMHPNHSTRLKLHLRNSQGDVVSVASAALDLLNNVKVEAIVGPQSSEQTKLVAELGSKFQVPILSFSATSPFLSSRRFPYFVRTTFNDSIQVKVIAELVQSFGWKEVIPIFEDSDYGYGILPYLVEAFQVIGIRIPYKSIVSVSATNRQLREELHFLKNLQARIFIVHASQKLAHRISLTAKAEHMMRKGYSWIMTCCLTDYLSSMNPSYVDAMQGILGISQYVPESKKLNDFMARWHNKFHQNNPNAKVAQPGSYGLLAYDTAWALAMAAEAGGLKSSAYQTNMTKPETLLNTLSNMEFDGVSGKFFLVNAQLDLTSFEIVNAIGYRGRKMGFWTSANGLSKCMNSKERISGIVWPGGSVAVPKNLDLQPRNNKLRIAIPTTSFTELVNYGWNPHTRRYGSGFCIEVFDMVMASLNDGPSYEYIPFNHSSYDDLVYQVYLQKFDAVVGDVSINANRSLYVDFTVPFADLGISMLVPIEYGWRKSIWIFLKPLKAELWLASGAFFVFTGIVVWVLEHRINDEFRGSPINQVGTALFFSFSTLFFAHREKIRSNLTRVVIGLWVFVVFILQSSYTASLTSMLTVQELHPAFTNLNDLIKNGHYIGFNGGSALQNLLKLDKSKLRAYYSVKEYDEALSQGSSRGGVSAIVDETPYVKIILSKYQDKYTMVGPIFQSDGFGFVFPKGSALVPNISKVILKSTDEIEKLYMSVTTYIESSTNTSPSLTLDSFWGLFLITGITSMSALIVYIILFLNEHWYVLSSIDGERSLWGRLATMAKLFDQKSYSSPASANVGSKEVNQAGLQGNKDLEITSTLSSHICETHCQEEEETIAKNDVASDIQASLTSSEIVDEPATG